MDAERGARARRPRSQPARTAALRLGTAARAFGVEGVTLVFEVFQPFGARVIAAHRFPAHYLEELFHWRGGHCGHRRSQHVRLHGGREIEKRLPMLLYGEFVKRLQPLAEDDSGIEDFEFADGILTEKVDGQDAMQWVKLLGGFADSSRGVEIQVDPVRGLSEGVA